MKQEAKTARVEKLGKIPMMSRQGASLVARALAGLEIGEAVAVFGATGNTLRSSIHRYQKLHGKKFTTRTLDDGRLGIWRVS